MPTGPKSAKEEKKQKESKSGAKESLMKPNSMVAKPGGTGIKDAPKVRRPDSLPTAKSARQPSPISRKQTNLSSEDDEFDDGLYEQGDLNKEADIVEKRSKTTGFVNPNPWKIPLKVDDPPYITNLSDDYPRDEYTMMPLVESAPKFYDGRHGPRLYRKDVKPGSIDTKKKLRKPNLSKEILEKGLMDDASQSDRPFIFKPKHIADVHLKKKYDDEVKGKSEVSLHLCDDINSFLVKNSLIQGAQIFDISLDSKGKVAAMEKRHNVDANSILNSHPDTRSSSSSNWSSVKFPREKVVKSLKSMGTPPSFPDIQGNESIL